jgi:hypothetical protein
MFARKGAIASFIGAILLPLVAASAPAAGRSFTGVISDSECDAGSHAHMRMGKDDAECAKACVDAHGASYVLWDGTRVYALSDQRAPAAFAGQRVTVIGELNPAGTVITVESINPAR